MTRFKSKAAFYAHKKKVYRDPDFLKESMKIMSLEDEARATGYRKLIEYYELVDGDAHNDFFENPLLALGEFNGVFSGGTVAYEDETGQFVAYLNPSVTHEQIEGLWRAINRLKVMHKLPTTKMKPPQNIDLLYAIFKARKSNMTFKQIFDCYTKSNLSGYEGKNNSQYASEDDLEAYYHKHYPANL